MEYTLLRIFGYDRAGHMLCCAEVTGLGRNGAIEEARHWIDQDTDRKEVYVMGVYIELGREMTQLVYRETQWA